MKSAENVVRRWFQWRSARVEPAAEDGFTLIELLMVVVLLPLVIGMVAIVMITVFKTTNTHDLQGTAERLAESHDAQITSAYFVRDVQTSTLIETTSSALCGTGTQLVGIEWNTNLTSTGPTWVSYVTTTVGGSPAVVRNYCTASAPGGTPTLKTTSTISHDVLSAAGVTQALTCNALYGSISGCVTGSSQQGPFASLYVSLVQVSIPEKSQTFTYILKASPRQLLASCSGTCPSPPAPPLTLLGSGGASCAAGNPSVTVNGTVAVNSSAGGSLAFHNGQLTATQVYSQDTGGTPPVSPPSDYNYTGSSGMYATGQTLNDAYSDLPVPNPSAPNTYVFNTALSGPNDGGNGLKSGIYILNAGISLKGNTALSSDAGGVFFYVTGGSVTIGGTASINLSSMSTGPYAGILLYQVPSDTSGMTLDGSGSATTLNGVIAAPSATVSLKGGGSGTGLQAEGLEAASLSCNGNGSAVLGPPLNTSTTLISSSNPSQSGANVTFTATIASSPSGYPAPTSGTVTFTETPNGAAIPVTMCSGVALSGSSATCSTSALIGGPTSPYSIVATYSGTAGYNGSTSSSLSQIVQLTGVTLASSANPSVSGQAVTFTATVTGGSGNVVFTIKDKNNLAYTCTGGNTVAPAGGSAVCAIGSGVLRSSLSTYTVSATYSSQNATPLTQTVNKGKIHISGLSQSAKVTGSNWKAKVVVTVVDGFGNSVSGVTVTGSFSAPATNPNCASTTNASGQCTVTSANIATTVPSETWTVTASSGLSSTDYTWDSASDTSESIVIPQ